jgi:hypothetical protein
MIVQFEIESIFKLQIKNKVCILARLLDSNLDWKLSEKSKLGQVEIENWFDIPRALDKNGKQRLDLFAFVLKSTLDRDKLKINQIVDLIP